MKKKDCLDKKKIKSGRFYNILKEFEQYQKIKTTRKNVD